MTKNKTKLALRRNRLNIWKEGTMKAFGREPTENEIRSFIAGFNVGYKTHKIKVFK